MTVDLNIWLIVTNGVNQVKYKHTDSSDDNMGKTIKKDRILTVLYLYQP